jgi:AraC-like DNA-binding protein
VSLSSAPGSFPELALRACSSSYRALACAGASELRPSRCEASVELDEGLLERLQAALALDLLEASLPRIALRFGTSSRSLQRRLLELGTSFRLELETARLHDAKRRLRTSNLPVTRIALDVGFASLQSFSRCFRRSTGLSPRAWRSAPPAGSAAEMDQQVGGSGNAKDDG